MIFYKLLLLGIIFFSIWEILCGYNAKFINEKYNTWIKHD